MDNSTQPSQSSRFFIAAALSLAVLFGWSYFFAPKPNPENANTAQNAANTAQTPAPIVQQTPVQTQQTQTVAATPDNIPNKVITIRSPLYQVKLDTRGALATSWILIKNVSRKGERELWAEGSNENNKIPLELISPAGLARTPGETPFRLSVGDAGLDSFLNERNYQVSTDAETFELSGSDSKQIDFTLKDETGLEVTKSFVFHADSYVTDLAVKIARNGQTIPNTKLLIGSNVGDQGIKHHDGYYRIETEAVAQINDIVDRHVVSSITDKKEDAGRLTVGGEVDWAGIGDSYFAMAAIPAQPMQGLEYRASKYEVEVEPFYDGIFAWITRSKTTKITRHLLTAYVPVNADGSTNRIYTGSKDYFTLSEYDEKLSQSAGRTIAIDDLINFSWYTWFRKIIKPISIGLVWCLSTINSFVHNFGLSIIIFTLIFYSIFFPIRWWQSKSFKKAQANAPKMKEIQDRMKDLQKKGVPADDPRMRQIQMEQLKLTKDAIPVAGCLPLLLQMPLFLALYVAVTIALDFRQASFLWLPDLSAADPWHILNFLFAGSMAGAMVLTPTTPAITPEQQVQQKMMTYLMPLMMLWLMWSVPAGLLLYWFFGNIVSFVQQFFINRMNKTNEPPKQEIVATVPKNVKKVKPKFSTS